MQQYMHFGHPMAASTVQRCVRTYAWNVSEHHFMGDAASCGVPTLQNACMLPKQLCRPSFCIYVMTYMGIRSTWGNCAVENWYMSLVCLDLISYI